MFLFLAFWVFCSPLVFAAKLETNAANCGVTVLQWGSLSPAVVQNLLNIVRSANPPAPWAFAPLANIVINGLLIHETTIQFRLAYYHGTTCYSAASAYHPVALETYGRTNFSNANRRCRPHVLNANEYALHEEAALVYTFAISGYTLLPHIKTTIVKTLQNFGFPVDVLDDGHPDAENIATPWGLARAVVNDPLLAHIKANDGWNEDGKLNRKFNSAPYDDFYFKDLDGEEYRPYGSVKTPKKYVKSPKKYSWEPLLESNNLGYFTSQRHITPQIGFTARLFGLEIAEYVGYDRFPTSIKPSYDYRIAVPDALNKTRIMATSDEKKIKIEFFDSKFTSLLPLQIQYCARNNFSSFRFWYADAILVSSMYNSIVLVWRQKIRFNLVRPPTIANSVMQFLTGNPEPTVESYAGPYQGAQILKVNDWLPYFRTMPHAEYPSGSSCVCTAFARTLEKLDILNGFPSTFDLPGPPGAPAGLVHTATAGSSVIEPELTPQNNLTFVFGNWESISRDCGESRLDGGMHFDQSIPAGDALCGGLTESVVSNFEKLVVGDPRGTVIKDVPFGPNTNYKDPQNLQRGHQIFVDVASPTWFKNEKYRLEP